MDPLHLITDRLMRAPVVHGIADALARGEDATLAASSVVRPALVAAMFLAHPRPTLVVVAGEEEAERFGRQLAAYVERDTILRFPERRTMPWARDARDAPLAGARARAGYALAKDRPSIVVASARSLARRLPPEGSQVFEPFVLAVGATLDLEEAADSLARMGYERLPAAEDRGQFAVRGGILDVFPSDGAFPVRAELFGDEIETLRRFVPSTQQSIGDIERIEAFACREIRLGTRAAQNVERAIARAALSNNELARDLELVEQGVYFDGIEAYLPIVYKTTALLTDYLAPDALVVVAEPRALFDDAARGHELVTAAAKTAKTDPNTLFVGPAGLDLGARQRLTFVSLRTAAAPTDADLVVRRPEVSGGEHGFAAGIRALMGSGYRVVIAARDRAGVGKLATLLVDGGISVSTSSPASDAAAGAARSDVAEVIVSDLPAGFIVPDAGLAVVSVDDVFPRAAQRHAADPTRLQFSFKPGDHVVHVTHGVAMFKEMTRREVLGVERDYLLLEYAAGDKLYVPVEQLDRVTKYVGPEGKTPRLTRLNTADWSRATNKARKAARTLAFDLVDLYARRSAATGFQFGEDTEMQREMEASFPFEETPDQLAAITEVKADMESDEPMDRLVCGDVGYGKTEVAIRAAFKALQDGKQVMVLCPTTILAQQHFTTFSERFAPFPVHVEVLSRFRTKQQQAEAIAGFAKGTVDLLIGTHRLLSADVAPHDLGLIVVDEEQRFGVEHKEHLKNLREQVDVLTLTATPIPRTLQMSLSGVRNMSVIDTPPPNRFPVHVHVGEYDQSQVTKAIVHELARGGQVYYIHNRVKTIDDAVRRVMAAVPDARVAVGHGQMSEHQLERVMESFAAGETDVLVATTIVESGIDNPHTNTLIIEDSERLGLGQLYQLKGRVGRSHTKAFAYFFFRRSAALTEEAMQRLTAISEHTELGAGIKIAMRDLEIRGAGALLGADQSGNVSAVGFDLYAEMLREAVSEARGEPLPAHIDINVQIPVPAFLPEAYIPEVDERVRFYRRLAGAVAPEAVGTIAAELQERFGAMPPAAADLVAVARVRAAAAHFGATNVAVVRHRLTVWPLTLSPQVRGSLAASLNAMYMEKDRKLVVPLPAGEPVAAAAVRVMDAIIGGATMGVS